MKKIIHLSDLHLGYVDLEQRFDCIISRIIHKIVPAQEYVIVITGDLVHRASLESYQIAKTYLDRLEEAGFTLLVVPGNHDYGSGSGISKRYVDMFKQYFFDSTEIEYPKVDMIDGIAFLGLDSMAAELHWYDRLLADGELGEAQLDRLEAHLNSEVVRNAEKRVVYLHHHPFDSPDFYHILKDWLQLGEILKSPEHQIDALLFGHNHHGRKWNGIWGIPRCLDAGSATCKENQAGYHRVLDLTRDPIEDYDADFHCNYLPAEEWPT